MYSAIAYHKKYKDGLSKGTLSLSTDFLIFRNDEDNVELPLGKLIIESAGDSNSLFFIKSPVLTEWVFSTSDKKLFAHPLLLAYPQHQAFFAQLNKRSRFYKSLALIFLSFITIFVIAVISLKGKLVDAVSHKFPVSYENDMGKKLLPIALAGKKIIRDTSIDVQLKEITKGLIKAVNDSNYSFRFYVIADSSINAFALPGGHIVIHSGLLLKASSCEEVLGVLAHEISHVTLRHHIRGQINQAGITLLIGALFGNDGTLTTILAENSAQLSILKYGRDLETEADLKGWEYLQKANIKPEGMISFFKKLAQEEGKLSGTRLEEFISTHPATNERIKLLEEQQSASGSSFSSFRIDYAQFKKQVEMVLKKGV